MLAYKVEGITSSSLFFKLESFHLGPESSFSLLSRESLLLVFFKHFHT
jgi:hypothetical protein